MRQPRSTIALGLLLAGVGAAVPLGLSAGSTRTPGPDGPDRLPGSVTLRATVRDFVPRGQPGGHPDFETYSGIRPTVGLVADTLGLAGTPLLANNGIGRLIANEWIDDREQPIRPAAYHASWGDSAGRYDSTNHRQVTNADTFNAWFADPQAANTAHAELTLTRRAGGTMFVLDSQHDEPWRTLGGFYPINGRLSGNHADTGKNAHFTTHTQADFVFSTRARQVLKVTTDADAWVYIDGRLVLDLGGQHPRAEQTVLLDRLDWLHNGQTYRLDIFHAHRRAGSSALRIETTLALRPWPHPAGGAPPD